MGDGEGLASPAVIDAARALRRLESPGTVTLPREAWARLKEAFEGARALALDARPAYLAEVCKGDEALRREVELLLAHNDQAASFLETPARPFDDSLEAKNLEGQCIGPYQIATLIGTGGMGEVYSARDTKLNRIVALKVLPERFALDPDRATRDYVSPTHLALTAEAAGDRDEAMAFARRAWDEREPSFILWARHFPQYRTLQTDPRFVAILREMNEP